MRPWGSPPWGTSRVKVNSTAAMPPGSRGMSQRAALQSKANDLDAVVGDLSRGCLATLKNDRADPRCLHAFPKPVSEVLDGAINDEKLNDCVVAIDPVRAEASFAALAPHIDAAEAQLDEVRSAQSVLSRGDRRRGRRRGHAEPQPLRPHHRRAFGSRRLCRSSSSGEPHALRALLPLRRGLLGSRHPPRSSSPDELHAPRVLRPRRRACGVGAGAVGARDHALAGRSMRSGEKALDKHGVGMS
jgi:hypothetical protein